MSANEKKRRQDLRELDACLYDIYTASGGQSDELDLDEFINLAIKNLDAYFLRDRSFYDLFLKVLRFDLKSCMHFRDAFGKLEQISLKQFRCKLKVNNYEADLRSIEALFKPFDLNKKLYLIGIELKKSSVALTGEHEARSCVDFAFDCFLLKCFFGKVCRYLVKSERKMCDAQVLVDYLVKSGGENAGADFIYWDEANFEKYLNEVEKEEQDAIIDEMVSKIDLEKSSSSVNEGAAKRPLFTRHSYAKILSNQQWQCNLCTFYNDADLVFCVICKVHRSDNSIFNV